jgi:hypothetical protein
MATKVMFTFAIFFLIAIKEKTTNQYYTFHPGMHSCPYYIQLSLFLRRANYTIPRAYITPFILESKYGHTVYFIQTMKISEEFYYE